MTSVSLGLRTSGSYGSLQQQVQNGGGALGNQTSPPLSNRKASKLFKEKESLFHWICKFAGRKKVGMLLLCLISAAVFVWVLYVGKGEDAQEREIIINAGLNGSSLSFNYNEYSSLQGERFGGSNIITSTVREGQAIQSLQGERFGGSNIITSTVREGQAIQSPAVYFTGYTLPPGNPCESFTLPPPPADKKRTGPRPCPVCYLPVEEAIALMPKAPSFSPVVKSLTYIHDENLDRTEFGGSQFGGYPSLLQRNDSYNLRESMNVHCGFVRGVQPGRQTGFDISDTDLFDMEKCQGIVVASAVFGAFDFIQQPKNISETAKKNVCFFMFVDEETEKFIKNFTELDSSKKIGLWRIVVVHNLPYSDPRRNGKVPKLLLHRLFPNARYSIWVDAKLELVVDPYQILERFLWRKNASFAISRHYRRYDVFVEAEANKAAGKYDNGSIDFQVDFYRREGLTPYTRAKLPISSDVPEGCVVIKEHIPISNLFTCLWFNEVDRFTSRDQISFAIVRDKIRSKSWTINMFLDCERRNFVVQGYHRGILERRARRPPEIVAVAHQPPPLLVKTAYKTLPPVLTQATTTSTQVPRNPIKRMRERRPSTKRHRKVVTVNRDIN